MVTESFYNDEIKIIVLKVSKKLMFSYNELKYFKVIITLYNKSYVVKRH